MIDPLAMPIFKPLWEAFPYLPGCFASWRGMSLGEISASAYATAEGERLPSGAIVGCMALACAGIGTEYPAIKSVDLEVLDPELSASGSSIHSTLVQIAGFFPEQRRPVGEPARHRLPA